MIDTPFPCTNDYRFVKNMQKFMNVFVVRFSFLSLTCHQTVPNCLRDATSLKTVCDMQQGKNLIGVEYFYNIMSPTRSARVKLPSGTQSSHDMAAWNTTT